MHPGACDIAAMRRSFLSLCALSSQEASCLRAIHTGKNSATQAQNEARSAAALRGLPSAPLIPLKGRIPDKPSETEIQVRSSLLYRAGACQVKRKNKKILSRGNHLRFPLSRAERPKTRGPAPRGAGPESSALYAAQPGGHHPRPSPKGCCASGLRVGPRSAAARRARTPPGSVTAIGSQSHPLERRLPGRRSPGYGSQEPASTGPPCCCRRCCGPRPNARLLPPPCH